MKSVYSNGISLTILQMNVLWLHLKFFIHSCCSVACSSHSYCKFQDCLIFLSTYTKRTHLCLDHYLHISIYLKSLCYTTLKIFCYLCLKFLPHNHNWPLSLAGLCIVVVGFCILFIRDVLFLSVEAVLTYLFIFLLTYIFAAMSSTEATIVKLTLFRVVSKLFRAHVIIKNSCEYD